MTMRRSFRRSELDVEMASILYTFSVDARYFVSLERGPVSLRSGRAIGYVRKDILGARKDNRNNRNYLSD